jgi:hypothetical protein
MIDNRTILVVGYGGHDFQLPLQIDQALKESVDSNIIYLYCDLPEVRCFDNPFGISSICKVCVHSHKRAMDEYFLNNKINIVPMSSIIKYENLSTPNFEMCCLDNIEIIKKIDHRGLNIGLGAVSSYVSLTRDIGPLLGLASQKIIGHFLFAQLLLIEILDCLYHDMGFTKIILHNGRFSHYRPFLAYAKEKKLDFLITESKYDVSTGQLVCDNYLNSTPHDFRKLSERITKYWEDANLSFDDKFSLGKVFYQRKRLNLFVGDNIYNPNHGSGFQFNPAVQNVVIFTSSEDEFFSVSHKEYDEIFVNQYESIKYILDQYRCIEDTHIWLRIHPNLKNVRFSHHLDLMNFDYPYLTIVPASSSISSYDLLDIAVKVFVYDSTIGLESVYQGKPTCALSSNYTYRDLNLVYVPNNIESLNTWIHSTNYTTNPNAELALSKYGFYIVYNNPIIREPVIWQKKELDFFGWKFEYFQEEKFLKSALLFFLIKKLGEKYKAWRLNKTKY